jgi:hypothetical protein
VSLLVAFGESMPTPEIVQPHFRGRGHNDLREPRCAGGRLKGQVEASGIAGIPGKLVELDGQVCSAVHDLAEVAPNARSVLSSG